MIDPQFLVNLKGKSYPLWAGVLDAATKAGLKSLTTTVLQMPTPENGNLAVVMARAEFEDGRIFEDVGDCSPLSTSANLASAALRLASTRAKGRCLRDAINVGTTMYEELPDLSGAEGEQPAPNNGHGREAPAAKGGCAECGLKMTPAQSTFALKTYQRELCPACQKAVFR